MLNACSIGCIWFLSPWMRRQGCRIAASSFFVNASRCESELPKPWQCHIDDRFLAYVHEHVPDLGQSVAIEWRVRGFIMCNNLSDTNVRKTNTVSSGEACTSSAKSADTSWGLYKQNEHVTKSVEMHTGPAMYDTTCIRVNSSVFRSSACAHIYRSSSHV